MIKKLKSNRFEDKYWYNKYLLWLFIYYAGFNTHVAYSDLSFVELTTNTIDYMFNLVGDNWQLVAAILGFFGIGGYNKLKKNKGEK